MLTARHVVVVMIVVHFVTTTAAPGSMKKGKAPNPNPEKKGRSVKKGKAKAGCDCEWATRKSSCEPHWNDESRCWGVCCNEKRGQLIGHGCCRTMGGGLRAWDEPSTAEAIAAKRVRDRPMGRTTCAVQCAALERCTHFELNMHDQLARSNQGVCSVFASGGYSVTTGCKDEKDVGKRNPRMHCFAAEAKARATLLNLARLRRKRLAADAAAAKAEKFRTP